MKTYITGIVITLFSILIASCCKNVDEGLLEHQFVGNQKGMMQVFVATVNAARNKVYVDGNAVNGLPLALGGIFPSTLANGFVLEPGTRSFLIKDTLPTTTQVPLNFQQQIAAGKKYMLFLYDTITSPKQKMVETDIIIPTDTSARLRVANFFYSKTAIPAFDIYSKTKNTIIFTNVKTTDVSDFIPFRSSYNDTLIFNEAGTQNIILQLNGFSLTPKRSYTMVLRGRYKILTGTDAMGITTFVTYE